MTTGQPEGLAARRLVGGELVAVALASWAPEHRRPQLDRGGDAGRARWRWRWSSWSPSTGVPSSAGVLVVVLAVVAAHLRSRSRLPLLPGMAGGRDRWFAADETAWA